MSLKSLLNQRAFITGGSKGIGKGIADKLSSLGCKVTLLSRNEKLLQNQVEYLNNKYPLDNGESHDYVSFDLNNVNDIEKVMKKNKQFIESNILVNCAGVTQNKLLMSIATEEIMKIMNVNLISAMILSKLMVKNASRLKDNQINANIINVSSVVSLSTTNLIGASVYSASKSALTRFTETLAAEQIEIHKRRPHSPLVRVNAVLPKHVSDTDIGKSVVQEKGSESPLGETTVADVAQAVAVLACGAAEGVGTSGAAVTC